MSFDDPFPDAPIRRSGEWYGLAGNLTSDPSRREVVLVLDYSASLQERTHALELCGQVERLLGARSLRPELPDIDPHEQLIRLVVRVPDAVALGEVFQEIHGFLNSCKRKGKRPPR